MQNSFEIDGVNLSFKDIEATKTQTNIQFTASKNADDLYTKVKTFVDANKIVKELMISIPQNYMVKMPIQKRSIFL